MSRGTGIEAPDGGASDRKGPRFPPAKRRGGRNVRRLPGDTLRECESRFQSLIESAGKAGQGIGIFQDRDGIEAMCVFANETFAEMLGYRRKDFLGRPMKRLLPSDLRESILDRYRRRQAGECVPPVYEMWVTRRGGGSVCLEIGVGVTILQNRTASIAFVRDITERRLMMEALERRIAFQRVVSEISARFVSGRDVDSNIVASLADVGAITGAGRAYLFLFRENGAVIDNTHEWCAPGVIPQRDYLQNVPCEAYQWWLRAMHRHEVIHVPNVSEMPAEAAAEKALVESQDIKSFVLVPVFVGGELGGMIGLDNVSEAVPWSEDDLMVLRMTGEIIGNAIERERSQRVEAESRALKELDRLRSQFIAAVSHDVRTPLTTIKGYASMLREGNRAPNCGRSAARQLDAIIRSADELTRLVDRLLDLSQLERGVLKLHVVPADIGEILRSALADARLRYPGRAVELELVPGLPRAKADPRRVRQVVDSLLENAIKYSARGTPIRVGVRRQEYMLLVSIADEGRGIPAEDLPRVFDPLFHIGRKKRPALDGVGLGLAIAKGLVEAQEGRIWIESTEGRGTVCSFTLPKADDESDGARV